MDLSSIDVTGDGMPAPTPYPFAGRTVYNGEEPCDACGIILNPVQALNSDLCPSCTKRKAAKQLANRMVG